MSEPDQPAVDPSGEGRRATEDPATGVADFAATGDARVDSVMRRLAGVTDLPASRQVAEYEAVHQVLQDALATVDEA